MAGKRKWAWAGMAAIGLLLVTGAYLFAIAPLLATNTVRISTTGSDGDANYDALDPAVAYNSVDNEFFVVWAADNPDFADGKLEIYGQRVSVADGSNLGSAIRISFMGDSDAALQYDAQRPAVAYNPNMNEYLVAWQADDHTLGDNEVEIFARRLDGSDGSLLASQIRVSHVTDMGSNRDALNTAAAYSSQSNRYLVAWQADVQADNEVEIYGALLDDSGTEQVSDFRISTMGIDGDSAYRGQQPDVAYNGSNNEFYVVWSGDDPAQASGAYEIYGRHVNVLTGALLGSQQRLSTMGSADSDPNYSARKPAVAYSSSQNQYLVVWLGDDDVNGADDKYEIYGQRVSAANTEEGSDTRISTTPIDPNAVYKAINPDVAYDAAQDQYKVVWRGDQDNGSMVNDQFEIFGQLLSALDLTPDGGNFRVSVMATTDGDTRFGADRTAVAFAAGVDNELVVWQGKTDTVVGLAEDEAEIFGRSVSCEAAAAVAPTIAITAVGTTARLTWSDDPANGGGYTVWRSNAPYSGHTQIDSLASSTVEYNDPNTIGDAVLNYFYLVRSENICGASSDDSNLVGEFDFVIVPGS